MYPSRHNGEVERNVLNHYNLQSTMPVEWPRELDDSGEDDVVSADHSAAIRRSKSRYSALERAASDRRTMLPNSQQTRDGRANLVQKDEADPLGNSGSVISMLRSKGVPVDQDIRLRNKFMLSSTSFSPALFLSQAHANASTEDLVQGMNNLMRSIDQKSASLKVLVETNFERFVRAKATIDNVYTEMRNQGIEAIPVNGPPSPRNNRHGRQSSRFSGVHQRITSGNSVVAPPPRTSKNALRKDSEYGTKGVRDPLLEVAQRAEDVWRPALGGKQREASLKAVAEAVEADRNLYELGTVMSTAVSQRRFDRVIELYATARKYADQATNMANRARSTDQQLPEGQIYKILVTGRMWTDVQEQIKELKQYLWRELSSTHHDYSLHTQKPEEEHMELINVLLELGVEDNPVWVWLLSRYDGLKNKTVAVTERSQIEIEILRRRLAATEPSISEERASCIRTANEAEPSSLDSTQVIEFWTTVSNYVNKLVSPEDGLIADVVEFWQSAKRFMDGTKQTKLSSGYNGESKKHHRLSEDGIQDLFRGVVELIDLIRDSLHKLFADPPTEDVSSLYTPLTGATPGTPLSPMFSPSDGRVGIVDQNSIPTVPSGGDQAFEKYAFWPPHANVLSATHYLRIVLLNIANGVCELLSIEPISRSPRSVERLKAVISVARERSVSATCAAWRRDSEDSTKLEDWTRPADKRDQTRLPQYFNTYERFVVNGLQRMLYLPDVTRSGSKALVTPPSSSSAHLIRQHFSESMLAFARKLVTITEDSSDTDEDEWLLVAQPTNPTTGSNEHTTTFDQSVSTSSQATRLLLTLSNVRALRSGQVPALLNFFEMSFTVHLGEESKRINDQFSETDRKLFEIYTQPTASYLEHIVKDGIESSSWEPRTNRPDQVSAYVYAALMTLVDVHTDVSNTLTFSEPATANGPPSSTASQLLLHETLSSLLIVLSQALLTAFSSRKNQRYTLPALIQATLDTEFIAQTLNQYSTKRVNDIQNDIYVELDKRTTNDARSELQKELTVMRGVLKRLREESRVSFGCFRKPKSGEGRDRPKADRQMTG